MHKKGRCVVLTGASGSGKTTLAQALLQRFPSLPVLFFDFVGVPSPEVMSTYGSGDQPGGAWQRAMTLEWMERVAELLRNVSSLLFEGQMRIAFIQEAFAACGVQSGQIILADCDDRTRQERLSKDRSQPELAYEHMMHWAAYLREEAQIAHCEILDTGKTPFEDCCSLLLTRLGFSTQ